MTQHDHHDHHDDKPIIMPNRFWTWLKKNWSIELMAILAAAIMAFAHYDAKADEHDKAIDDLRKNISVVEATARDDNKTVHQEMNDDRVSISRQLDRIGSDVSDIKVTQAQICASNKIRCKL